MENVFKEFEGNLIVSKELFYNEETRYGAYGFKFDGEPIANVEAHPIYKNFSIAGNVQQLVEGKSYFVRFKEGYDEKRKQNAYYFIEVPSEGIKGREANVEFLRAMLTEKQAKNIANEFPFEEELVRDMLEGKIDLTLVSGIGEVQAIKIQNKLKDVQLYSEAIIELSPLGVGIASVKRLVDYFGDPKTLLEKMRKNIYCLTKVDGFGFKSVDELAKKLGIPNDDPNRIRSGAFYVIEELVKNGDTKIDIELFDNKLIDILGIEEVSDELFSKILSNKGIYYEEGYISLIKYREEEREIVNELRRIRDNFNPVTTEEMINQSISKNELLNGYTFNQEQREAIYKGATNGVMIIDGRAGSGKTSSVRSIIEAIRDSNISIALSGKAANVLSQNGLYASTIHRALINIGKINIAGGGETSDPFFSEKMVVLDEASMVDNSIFLKIVQSIPNGTQLIIVGDSGQLPAIGRGAIFDNLLASTEFAHTTLKQVHRQAQDSGTLTIANMVREGKQFNSYTADCEKNGVEVYGKNNDFFSFMFQNKENIRNEVYSTVQRYINNPDTNNDDLQLITGLKERGELSVVNLNLLLQPLFNPETNSDDEFKSGKYTYRKNDKVIQQGNNYSARILDHNSFIQVANGFINLDQAEFIKETQVFNGTFGKIIECVKGVGMLIQFEGVEGLVFYEKTADKDEIGQLDLGYVISCHRSQGSGFKDLIVVVTFNEYMLLSRQFLYTALTRTIDKCFLFGETKAIHYAIKTDKGKTRKCFISDFLN